MKDKNTEELVTSNIKFAYHMAWKFNGRGIPMDELKAIALLGLVKAANAYDEGKGFKFSTFAGTVVQNEILMELRKLRRHAGVRSLDEPVNDDGENLITLKDVIPDTEKGFEKAELSDFAKTMLDILPSRQRQAAELTVCQGLRQEDVAKVMGGSQSIVSRYAKRAVETMRNQYWEEKACS